MTKSIIRLLNIILVGLLAGTSFGIWIGLNPIAYSVSTYIEQQQHLVNSLNTLMISLVILATLITIVSAYFQRQNKSVFIALLIAAAFLASCIFISRFGNLPIQKKILTWNVGYVPNNWTIFRDKWWSFHILRTMAELSAFVLIAWTSVQKQFTK